LKSIYKKKAFHILGLFTLFFTLISTLRPYQLVSKVGWLDPWLSMGMGQVFPRTSFPWNYYKESRILSILYQFVLTNSSTSTYILLQTFTISVFGVLLYIFLLNFTSKHSLALTCSLIGVLNPLLWGDLAGGADYYNLMGNLLVLLGIYLLWIILGTSDFNNLPKFPLMTMGVLSYLIAVEIPSGVIVVFIFQFALILRLASMNKSDKNLLSIGLSRLIIQQILGVLFLLFLEIILLLAFQQSPSRLISGPKFLLNSIINSSVQETWWRKLDYSDLISKQYLQGFLIFGALIFLLIMFKKSLYRVDLISGISYTKFIEPVAKSFVTTWIVLIVLQITEKSVALTLDYFATPFLVIGFTLGCTYFLHLFENDKSSRKAFFALPFLIYWFPISVPNQFLLLSILTILLFTSKLKIAKMGLLNSFLLLVIGILCINGLGVNKESFSSAQSSQFKICENERLAFRNWALEEARKFDLRWGPRGSNLMSSDAEVLDMVIKSPCDDLDGRPLTDALLSFSQLGFPGVSILGSITNTNSSTSYPYQYFAEPFNRENKPLVCVVNWQLKTGISEDNVIRANIFGNQILAELWCPKISTK
jgi:hypothetical protein